MAERCMRVLSGMEDMRVIKTQQDHVQLEAVRATSVGSTTWTTSAIYYYPFQIL